MRTGALVLGFAGALLALALGVLGFALGDLGIAAGARSARLLLGTSVFVSAAGLFGAGIVRAKPLAGGVLLVAAAVGVVAFVGVNCVSLAPGLLLLLGGVLGFLGVKERPR